MTEDENNRIVWFAMSAPYRRELKARDYLTDIGIECFVPMTRTIVQKQGHKKSALIPAVHNLLFVHTTRNIINRIKKKIEYLQFRTFPSEGRNKPITVADRDMEQFMTVTRDRMEEIIYISPDEIDVKKGTKVRIHGGTFNGITGVLQKIKGKRNRRVVVLIEGVAAVAINAEITPDLIEIIE